MKPVDYKNYMYIARDVLDDFDRKLPNGGKVLNDAGRQLVIAKTIAKHVNKAIARKVRT